MKIQEIPHYVCGPESPLGRTVPADCHRLGQNSTPSCHQNPEKFNTDGRDKLRLEVVRGALCDFLSEISVPQANPTQPVCDRERSRSIGSWEPLLIGPFGTAAALGKTRLFTAILHSFENLTVSSLI